MIIIAFFFLLRPGQYQQWHQPILPGGCSTVYWKHPHPATDCPHCAVKPSMFASLTFINQKNGVQGEVIGLACSRDPYVCPVQAIICQVLYLHQHSAPLNTPLAHVFNTNTKVTAAALTACIRNSVTYLGPELGFLPSDVSACCLREAGATALLLAQVDPDVIRLIGRWRSDEMLCYLHVQAYPLMRNYAQQMLHAGEYTLIPNHLVPQR